MTAEQTDLWFYELQSAEADRRVSESVEAVEQAQDRLRHARFEAAVANDQLIAARRSQQETKL